MSLLSFLMSRQIRQEAIQSTRDRNPSAFQMKVSVKRGHVAGCNCKKSRCLKKYCECFEGSVFCGPNCKCVECQNHAGSEVHSSVHSFLIPWQALKQVKSNLRDKKEKPQRIELCGTESPNPEMISPKILQPPSLEGVSATPFKDRTRSFTRDDYHQDKTKSNIFLSPGQSNSPSQSFLSSSDIESSPNPSNTFESPDSTSRPLKKRRVAFPVPQKREPMYPFFGSHRPPITKLIALSCLEYLDGPSLYSMSCVNRIWCQAAMDDALWE